MSELTNLGLKELAEGLKNKSFSSIEVTKAHLDRINNLDQKLNSFITICKDSAIKAAEDADQALGKSENGKLLGVPIALKDIIVTKGIKTTCASKILENFVPPYDATVTSKIYNAGAVLLGKTNMDEFAMGSSNENSYFGAVSNPWDTSKVPGGSSGGSAAAVAARLAPAALGTDTGGSVRQPASLCNLVGLRPTYGRISRYGIVAFASSLDQVGIFTRNATDCAYLSEVVFGHDVYDSTSVDVAVPEFSNNLNQGVKGLRLGVPKEYFVEGMSAEVEEAVKKAISELESQGAEIVEVSLPHTELAVPAYYVINPAEASSNLARYDGIRYGYRAEDTEGLMDLYCKTRSEGFGTEVKRRIMIGTFVLSQGYYDAYYLKAQKVRALIAKDFKDIFESKCDAVVCPTTPTTAFNIGEKTDDPIAMYLNDIFTVTVNLAGLPGISIPCGKDSAGLPIGLQIIGKAWDEETLFRIAAAYEQNTEWHKRVPEVS